MTQTNPPLGADLDAVAEDGKKKKAEEDMGSDLFNLLKECFV